jgi:2-oxoglutarate ferredoxin oxidoreductase subunit delta
MKGSITIDRELCKGCQVCIEFCPRKVISIDTRVNAAGYLPATPSHNEECTGCSACAVVCPDVAIEVYRE